MIKLLVMLTFCVIAKNIYGKSLIDYNVTPQHDLVADESTSYSNFWTSSEFNDSPVTRFKHQTRGWGYGRGNGRRRHDLYPYNFGFTANYHYHNGGGYHFAHPHHHAHSHGFFPNHHRHEPPRRFPPPPVYDNGFINPWAVTESTHRHFTVQTQPLTTPRPIVTTPAFYVAPKLTTRRTTQRTTPAPTSSTTTDDQLIYDIDVRFGRD